MALIGIQIGEDFLKLDPTQQFAFDEIHPAFNDDFSSSNNSLPITIPAEENDLILNIPANLNGYDKIFEYTCKVWISSSQWKRGKLIIDKAGTKTHGGYVLMGIRSLESLDKKLWEIDLGGERFIGADSDAIVAHAKAVALQSWPDVEYNFPTVRNNDFYSTDANPDWEYFINRWDRSGSKYIKNVDGGTGDPINKDSIVPMPYYNAIVNRIFKNEGYSVNWNCLAGQRDVMWNNFPLDYRFANTATGNAYVAMSSPFNISAIGAYILPLDSESTPYYDNGGNFNTGTFKYNIADPGRYRINVDVRFHFPYLAQNETLLLALMLDGTALATNQTNAITSAGGLNFAWTFQLDATFLSGDVNKKIYLLDAITGNFIPGGPVMMVIDSATLRITDTSDFQYLNRYSNTLNLQNHVPDVTVRDFLQAFKTHYNCYFDIDENIRKVYVENATDILTRDPVDDDDVNAYADPEHESDVTKDKIKLIGFDWPGDDDLLNDNFLAYDTGTNLGDFDTVADLPTPTVVSQTARINLTNQRYISVEDPMNPSSLVWTPYCDNYYDNILDAEATIEVRDKITPLMMRSYNTTVTGSVLVPEISQAANSKPFGQGTDRIQSLRVIHYEGMSTEGYPFATTQNAGIISGSGIDTRIVWEQYVAGTNQFDLLKDWIPVMNAKLKQLFTKDFYFDINYFLQILSYGSNIVIPRRLSQRRILFYKNHFAFEDNKLGTQVEFFLLP